MKRSVFIFISICLAVSFCAAQKTTDTQVNKIPASDTILSALKSSQAFAEISLRRTELRSEIESLLVTYTEEFPKVKEYRFELGILDKDLSRLLKVKPEESGKLTIALGKLIVRKAALEVDLWDLQKKYGDDYPDVKRAKKKVEVFEKAIAEILN